MLSRKGWHVRPPKARALLGARDYRGEHLVRMLMTSSKTGLAATGYGLAAATATSSAATLVNRRGPDQTAVRGRLIP